MKVAGNFRGKIKNKYNITLEKKNSVHKNTNDMVFETDRGKKLIKSI